MPRNETIDIVSNWNLSLALKYFPAKDNGDTSEEIDIGRDYFLI